MTVPDVEIRQAKFRREKLIQEASLLAQEATETSLRLRQYRMDFQKKFAELRELDDWLKSEGVTF